MGTIYEIKGDGASKGAEISIANSTTIKEVAQASDLDSPLLANTTYVIRGTITTSSAISVTNSGCAIIGHDRNKDKLIYTGPVTFLTVTEQSFTLRHLRLQATTGKVLSATNITQDDSENNYNRTKTLVIDGCEIRNTTNVWDIEGYELVDLNNVLIWYIKGTLGCQFAGNRHLEISSCEFFNWQEESGPAISTAKMIELQTDVICNSVNLGTDNQLSAIASNTLGSVPDASYTSVSSSGGLGSGLRFNITTVANVVTSLTASPGGSGYLVNDIITVNGVDIDPAGTGTFTLRLNTAGLNVGFAVVNINSCIIHPIEVQTGVDVTLTTTTKFGTIASNTFIDVGLDIGAGGKLISPVPATGGYSVEAMLKYDIGLNQGIPNSISYGFFQEPTGGTDTLTGGTTNWIPAEYGAIPSNTSLQRFGFANPATNRGTLKYTGTKSVFVTLTVSIIWNDTSGGTDTYNFGIIKNGSATPEVSSIIQTRANGGVYSGIALTFTDTPDKFDIYELAVQNPGGGVGDDVDIISVQFLIKE